MCLWEKTVAGCVYIFEKGGQGPNGGQGIEEIVYPTKTNFKTWLAGGTTSPSQKRDKKVAGGGSRGGKKRNGWGNQFYFSTGVSHNRATLTGTKRKRKEIGRGEKEGKTTES